MTEPLLSVCIITFNHINFIKEAIEGVLKQKTNFSIEIIIADDFSTDGTRDIILEYKKKHPELFTLILQKDNVGVNRNWMDMVKTPKSKYIAFCDGDDYWIDPYKLQKQVDFLENNPDYSICFHPAEYIYENHKSSRIFKETYEISDTTFTEDLIKNDYIPFCSCIVRRNSIKQIPFWFFNIKALDWPLLLIASFGKKIYRLKDKMAVYRIHDNSIWATKKYSFITANSLDMLCYLEKDTPDRYVQLIKDKKFNLIIELYKTYLAEGNFSGAAKLLPGIYSYNNHQNFGMATKIIIVSAVRKIIPKKRKQI